MNLKKRLLFDGAMGTMLQIKGLGQDCPEEWNTTHPDVLREIHKAYLDAGSDVIETNTFGANRFKLAKFGLQKKVSQLNRADASMAKELAGEDRFVAGAVGPTGEFLEPVGQISESQMYEAFAEQVYALQEGGADLICVETMSDPEEAGLALRAAKENTNLPVITSMLFEPGPKGFRTMMGTDVKSAVEKLKEAGADALGTNCGNGIELITEIVKEINSYTDGPILGMPNAGVPQLKGGQTVFPESPEFMAAHIEALLQTGANIIGGCCGTTPEHIEAMAREFAKLR